MPIALVLQKKKYEQIVFSQLGQEGGAVWSLLLASGYLKAVYTRFNTEILRMEYGLQRHDIMLEPKDKTQDAFVIEFKVTNTRRGESLEAAVESALGQIEKRKYEANLIARGFAI